MGQLMRCISMCVLDELYIYGVVKMCLLLTEPLGKEVHSPNGKQTNTPEYRQCKTMNNVLEQYFENLRSLFCCIIEPLPTICLQVIHINY